MRRPPVLVALFAAAAAVEGRGPGVRLRGRRSLFESTKAGGSTARTAPGAMGRTSLGNPVAADLLKSVAPGGPAADPESVRRKW